VLINIVSTGYYFYQYGGPGYQNYAFVAVCGGASGLSALQLPPIASIFMGDTGSLVCGFISFYLPPSSLSIPTVGSAFGSAAPVVALGILLKAFFLRYAAYLLCA
jgi:hypothetical protein